MLSFLTLTLKSEDVLLQPLLEILQLARGLTETH